MTDFENVKRYDFYGSKDEFKKGDFVYYTYYESLLFAYKSLLEQYKQEFVNRELEKKV